MAIGGLAGIYFYLKPNISLPIWIKCSSLALTSYILIYTTEFGFGLDNIIAAISFAFLLIIVATTDNIRVLEIKVFRQNILWALYVSCGRYNNSIKFNESNFSRF